jgi:hypothetical protein
MTQQSDENLKADEELTLSQEKLDEFEESIGLVNPVGFKPEVSQYFKMNSAALQKLSREQCGEAAYELAQYSYWVQQTLNRENSKLAWADATLKVHIGKNSKRYRNDKYISYEEVQNLVIADNSYAHSLFSLKMKAKLRIERLSQLATKIEFMSKTMQSLQYRKE